MLVNRDTSQNRSPIQSELEEFDDDETSPFPEIEDLIQLYNESCDRKYLTDAVQLADAARETAAQDSLRELYERLGSAYSDLYESTDDVADLESSIHCEEECLRLCPPDHDDRPLVVYTLTLSLSVLQMETMDHEVLNRLVDLQRELVAAYPDGSDDHVKALRDLAEYLDRRGDESGDGPSTKEAIHLFRNLLAHTQEGSVEHLEMMRKLAITLHTDFRHSGRVSSINESAVMIKAVADGWRQTDSSRHQIYYEAAGIWSESYERTGMLQSLHQSITFSEEALGCCEYGTTSYVRTLSLLSACSSDMFEHTRSLDFLEDAIKYNRCALSLANKEYKDLALLLTNLSYCLYGRFEATGDRRLLEDAEVYGRKALSLRPIEDPMRPLTLNAISVSLHMMYSSTGRTEPVMEAICLEEEALGLCPVGHVDRPLVQENLGGMYRSHFLSSGDLRSLHAAITCYEEVLHLRPTDSPTRFMSMNQLGHLLLADYDNRKNVISLEAALKVFEDAAASTPSGHALEFGRHASLALPRLRYDSPLCDVSTAVAHLHKAVFTVGASPKLVLNTVVPLLQGVEDYLQAHEVLAGGLHAALLELYQQVLTLSTRVGHLGLEVSARLEEFNIFEATGVAAALHALALSQPETAFELLEQGRGVFWAQSLRTRASIDTLPSDYSTELKDLFQALQLSDRLQNFHQRSRKETILEPAWSNAAVTRRRRQGERVEALLAEIRTMPSFERFLMPDPFSLLAGAAANGPVVVLLSLGSACEAIAITSAPGNVKRIPFRNLQAARLRDLSDQVQESQLRSRKVLEASREVAGRPAKVAKLGQPSQKKSKQGVISTVNEGSQHHRDPEDMTGEEILAELWKSIVKPVLDALEFKVSLVIH
jgi:hypothetical protein